MAVGLCVRFCVFILFFCHITSDFNFDARASSLLGHQEAQPRIGRSRQGMTSPAPGDTRVDDLAPRPFFYFFIY